MGGNLSRIGNIFPDVAIKAPCHVATTAAITLSGLQTIDDVALVEGDRVLVKDQTNQKQNGIYAVQTGLWQRTVDASKNTDLVTGTMVMIAYGTTQARVVFQVATADPVIIGSSLIAFTTAHLFVTGLADIRNFGAVGDGVTDDSAALAALLTEPQRAGQKSTISPGTYLVDYLPITVPIDLEIQPGATLKLRRLPDPIPGQDDPTNVGGFGVLDLQPGSEGSRIFGGGTIDGNRDGLLADFLALPHTTNTINGSYVIDFFICGTFNRGVHKTKVRDLRLINNLGAGFLHFNGNACVYEDLQIEDSTKALGYQFCNDGKLSNITGRRIGNAVGTTVVPLWQHGFEIRDCLNTYFEDLIIKDYSPHVLDNSDVLVGDPLGLGMTFERCDDCHWRGLISDTYLFPESTQNSKGYGLNFSSCRNMNVVGADVFGYLLGVELATCTGKFGDVILDGNFNTASLISQSVGLNLRGGGINPIQGLVDTDSHASSANSGLYVHDIEISRFDTGSIISGGDVSIDGMRVFGNLEHGVLVTSIYGNSLGFPGGDTAQNGSLTLAGVDSFNNGQAGLAITQGYNVTIDPGCSFDDNGQDPDGTDAARSGVWMVGADPKQNIFCKPGSVSDLQDWTITDFASFNPGGSDNLAGIVTTNGTKRLSVLNNARVRVGQHLKFVGAASGPADITAKVVNVDRDWIDVESSDSWVASGNTTALTGAFTSAGTALITATGSALLSQVPGRRWITNGSEWREVSKIVDDNTMYVTQAFTAHLSSSSLSVLSIDVSAIPSQQYGIRTEFELDGPLFFDALTTVARGNLKNNWKIVDQRSLGPNSTLVWESGAVPIDTGAVTTLIFPVGEGGGFVKGAAVLGYTYEVITNIGTAVSSTLEISVFGGSTTTLDTPALAAGTKVRGAALVTNTFAADFFNFYQVTFNANPSSGSVKGSLLLRTAPEFLP